LFLVNKQTEILGNLLEDAIDYALIKLQMPISADQKAEIQAQINNKGIAKQQMTTVE